MKTIGVTEFKQRCLALLDRLGPDGLVITKHGRPVARVIPVDSESSSLIGRFAGQIEIKGDIESTGIAWDAES
ncbi:MAG TPA: type II toxin-antitoxin system Phd/YefM family antitoxin [Gemmatimonadota bacterium]|nr:type II toxin-antitoxin system Phd/YefM family antitoxin [Gemmatimonadota bacterium]